MSNSVCVIIPFRLDSTRFPEKALAIYRRRTLLETSIRIAKKFSFASKIAVTSDKEDQRVIEICEREEVEFVLTSSEMTCGTERVYYASKAENLKGYNTYISLPIDEPSIDPEEVNKVWKKVKNHPTDMITTLFSKFYDYKDIDSINTCKIVDKNKRVLYTSRAVIPASKSGMKHPLSSYKRHIGLFIFPKEIFNKYGKRLWAKDINADLESLEQNKFIPFGLNLAKIRHIGLSIDTPDDIGVTERRVVTDDLYR